MGSCIISYGAVSHSAVAKSMIKKGIINGHDKNILNGPAKHDKFDQFSTQGLLLIQPIRF